MPDAYLEPPGIRFVQNRRHMRKIRRMRSRCALVTIRGGEGESRTTIQPKRKVKNPENEWREKKRKPKKIAPRHRRTHTCRTLFYRRFASTHKNSCNFSVVCNTDCSSKRSRIHIRTIVCDGDQHTRMQAA